MVVSDHRPVSMVMTLEVNSAVMFPLNFVEKLDEKKLEQNNRDGAGIEIVGKGRYFLYELIITNLEVNLLEHEQKKEDVILDAELDASTPMQSSKQIPMGGAIQENDDDGDEEMGWATRNPMFPSETEGGNSQLELSSSAPTMSSRPISSRMVDIDLNRKSEIAQSYSDKSTGDLEKAVSAKRKQDKKRPSIVGALFNAGKDLITGSKREHEAKSRGSRSIKATITHIQVCFPLPGKDPLLRFRQISSLAKAFEVGEKSILDNFQDVALRALENKYPNGELDRVKTAKESLTADYSTFPCTCQHRIGQLTENGGVADLTFASGKENEIIGEIIHSDVISCAPMRVCGCIVPELGTHVVIVLVDAKGDNHGEFTISLSHLVDLKSNSRKDDSFSDIPVSRGGELRGKASGMFSLSLLTILSTDDNPAMARVLS